LKQELIAVRAVLRCASFLEVWLEFTGAARRGEAQGQTAGWHTVQRSSAAEVWWNCGVFWVQTKFLQVYSAIKQQLLWEGFPVAAVSRWVTLHFNHHSASATGLLLWVLPASVCQLRITES